jgi:hypothetical protein
MFGPFAYEHVLLISIFRRLLTSGNNLLSTGGRIGYCVRIPPYFTCEGNMILVLSKIHKLFLRKQFSD